VLGWFRLTLWLFLGPQMQERNLFGVVTMADEGSNCEQLSKGWMRQLEYPINVPSLGLA